MQPFTQPSQDAYAVFAPYMLLTPTQLSASTSVVSGPSLEFSAYRHYFAQWQFNGGSFVGAISIEGSCDGSSWVELSRTAVAATNSTGSFNGDFNGMQLRMQSTWASGNSASLTGSVTLKAG